MIRRALTARPPVMIILRYRSQSRYNSKMIIENEPDDVLFRIVLRLRIFPFPCILSISPDEARICIYSNINSTIDEICISDIRILRYLDEEHL